MNIIEEILATGFNAEAGAMFLMLGAVVGDDANSQQSSEQFWAIVSRSPFFWGNSEKELSTFFDISKNAWGKIGSDDWGQIAPLITEVLGPNQRDTAFALTVDVAMATGGMSDFKLQFIRFVLKDLKIPQETSDSILEAVAIRYFGEDGMLPTELAPRSR